MGIRNAEQDKVAFNRDEKVEYLFLYAAVLDSATFDDRIEAIVSG